MEQKEERRKRKRVVTNISCVGIFIITRYFKASAKRTECIFARIVRDDGSTNGSAL